MLCTYFNTAGRWRCYVCGDERKRAVVRNCPGHHTRFYLLPVPDGGVSNTKAGVVTGVEEKYWPCLGALVIAAHQQGLGFAIADHGLSSRQRAELNRVGVQWIEHKKPPLDERNWTKYGACALKTWWKPFVCQASPFERSVWVDGDSVITGDMDELFATERMLIGNQALWRCSTTVSVYMPLLRLFFDAETQEVIQRDPFIRAWSFLNAGVVAWSRGEPLIDKWAHFCLQIFGRPEAVKVCQVKDQSGLILSLVSEHLNGGLNAELLPVQWNIPADGYGFKEMDKRKPVSDDPTELLRQSIERHPGARIVHWLGSLKPWDLRRDTTTERTAICRVCDRFTGTRCSLATGGCEESRENLWSHWLRRGSCPEGQW